MHLHNYKPLALGVLIFVQIFKIVTIFSKQIVNKLEFVLKLEASTIKMLPSMMEFKIVFIDDVLTLCSRWYSGDTLLFSKLLQIVVIYKNNSSVRGFKIHIFDTQRYPESMGRATVQISSAILFERKILFEESPAAVGLIHLLKRPRLCVLRRVVRCPREVGGTNADGGLQQGISK